MITFHPTGGTVSPESKTLTEDDTVYGELPEPSQDGYTFEGWFTATENGTQITQDTPFVDKSDQFLYAVWSKTVERYTVRLAPNGGTVSPSSVTAAAGGVYGELPVPARKGCEFAGWYTEPIGGEPVTADTPVTRTADHALYAHWTATPEIKKQNGQAVETVEQLSTQTEQDLSGSLTVIDTENRTVLETATAFCAVYDEQGMMVYLQSWELDVTDAQNICFTGSVHIPRGVSVSEIKIMVLSDNLVPLQAAGIL